jgi:hypothetical protein
MPFTACEAHWRPSSRPHHHQVINSMNGFKVNCLPLFLAENCEAHAAPRYLPVVIPSRTVLIIDNWVSFKICCWRQFCVQFGGILVKPYILHANRWLDQMFQKHYGVVNVEKSLNFCKIQFSKWISRKSNNVLKTNTFISINYNWFISSQWVLGYNWQYRNQQTHAGVVVWWDQETAARVALWPTSFCAGNIQWKHKVRNLIWMVWNCRVYLHWSASKVINSIICLKISMIPTKHCQKVDIFGTRICMRRIQQSSNATVVWYT